MLHDPAIETYARQLLREEWDRDERHTRRMVAVGGGHDSESPTCDGRETYWVLPEVLELLAELGKNPIEELEPKLRALITEHQFVDETGDSIAESSDDIDHEVRILLRALERVRTFAIGRGHIPGSATTPIMFG